MPDAEYHQSEDAPFFLVGAERSGSTLLRLMLDHHPLLAWHSEFEFAVDMMPEGDGWPDMNAYREHLQVNRVFNASGHTINPELDFPSLVKDFLAQKKQRSGKPIVGGTVHRHFDRLERVWPEARFIHLLRDGRDVARSTIGMGWAGTVWTGAERWIHAEEIWDRMCARIPADRRYEVRMEDIITNTVPTLAGICAFIGVPYDDAMMSYPEHTTYSHPDPKLVDQWRRKMSEEDIRIVEARIGPMLEKRGYPLSGLPPLEVTPAMIKKFHRQDWQARLKARVDRFGWPLLLAEVITRKAGLKPLWKPLKRRIDEKTKRLLK